MYGGRGLIPNDSIQNSKVMKYTIKFKIQVAIAIIIATVSAVQAWISINQLRTETTKQVHGQMTDIGQATSNYVADWMDTRT